MKNLDANTNRIMYILPTAIQIGYGGAWIEIVLGWELNNIIYL